jgi:hypothetical protein
MAGTEPALEKGISIAREIAMPDQATTLDDVREHPVVPAKLSGDVLGALINLSGRRRFTSQRVVLYAVLASLGHDGAIETARQTLALFCDAHTTLVQGKGGMPGIFCEQVRDAYYGQLRGNQVIEDFIGLAGDAIDAVASDARQAPGKLDELVRSATPLLAVLNALTLVYEEQSKRHAIAQRKQMNEMMGDIKTIAKQARFVAFNAQIAAARAGDMGKEFSVMASAMTNITGEIDILVQQALNGVTT